MKTLLKTCAILAATLGVFGGSVDRAEATGYRNAQVYVEVYRVPYGDWLNVRQWPSPSARKVGRLFNGDQGVVDLNDCWDARYDRRIRAHDVYFNGAAVWCGIRAGHHGRIYGYVRTSFVHAQ